MWWNEKSYCEDNESFAFASQNNSNRLSREKSGLFGDVFIACVSGYVSQARNKINYKLLYMLIPITGDGWLVRFSSILSAMTWAETICESIRGKCIPSYFDWIGEKKKKRLEFVRFSTKKGHSTISYMEKENQHFHMRTRVIEFYCYCSIHA